MSSSSWQERFLQTLQRLNRTDRAPRVAIVGIGHELRGDDAAGLHLIRALQAIGVGSGNFLMIDAGNAPENFVGALRSFDPDLVLLVDAAQMGAEAGAVHWLDWQAASGFSGSTHTLPLHVLGDYLEATLGCQAALLGIQPAGTSFGDPLSAAVQKALERTARQLAQLLQDCQPRYQEVLKQ